MLSVVIIELILIIERSILKQISETYGAKVEASTRDQAIRLTSDFETCLDILKLIVHTLNNIRSSDVGFPAEFSPDLLALGAHKDAGHQILRQIMQSTNTIIKETVSPASDRQASIKTYRLVSLLSFK